MCMKCMCMNLISFSFRNILQIVGEPGMIKSIHNSFSVAELD